MDTTITPVHNETLGITQFCNQDELRTSFSLAMSAMYKNEVPLYGDLVRIVREVNRGAARTAETMSSERLDLERHGAVRLGTPHELRTVRRMFAIIGLSPVGYYDLSKAGLPMHATAFRPITQASLAKNPFRVFTTLLRPELLSQAAHDLAVSHLLRRNIFSDELMTLIGVGEEQGGLFPAQGERFVIEALRTFQWEAVAATTIEDYFQLRAEHPILADIACFKTAHINHLTPRVLDIEACEARMKHSGLSVKSRIEGPPARRNPILLRQTSFLALQEPVKFRSNQSHELVDGHHRARFGEIEQRGAAVTIKGRKLYDEILARAMQRAAREQEELADGCAINLIFTQEFEQYPDVQASLIQQGLIFCSFQKGFKANDWCSSNKRSATVPLSILLEQGVLEAEPLTYEDFLPLSAAGIFKSNLQERATEKENGIQYSEDKEGLEASLGCSIMDPDELYTEAQRESLNACARDLGFESIVFDY